MDINKFELTEYEPRTFEPNEKFVNTPIVKSCEAKHNIAKDWNIIKLGTSGEFKEDTSESGDSTEGAASFSWDFVTGNAVGWNNHVIMRKIPSIYMYCASLSDKILFEKYDDKYYILDGYRFMTLVARLLEQELKPEHFEEHQPSGLSIGPPYTVNGVINVVRYGKIFHHNNPNLSSAELYYNACFRKPKQYSREREVRMAFQIGKPNERYMLSIKSDPIYLDISSVRTEIDQIVSLAMPSCFYS